MKNYVIVKSEDGEDIKIELILSFKIEEYHKQYVVYTLNDDSESSSSAIFISEIDRDGKLISIPNEQKEIVLAFYEEAKKTLMES